MALIQPTLHSRLKRVEATHYPRLRILRRRSVNSSVSGLHLLMHSLPTRFTNHRVAKRRAMPMPRQLLSKLFHRLLGRLLPSMRRSMVLLSPLSSKLPLFSQQLHTLLCPLPAHLPQLKVSPTPRPRATPSSQLCRSHTTGTHPNYRRNSTHRCARRHRAPPLVPSHPPTSLKST